MKKKQKLSLKELDLKSKKKFEGEIIVKASEILRTQTEYLSKTIKRFIEDLERIKKQLT